MALPRLLEPLRIRDYAVLWSAMTISYLGDGIFLVASAWQVYELSNDPAALSLVWVVWAIPLVALLLLGGVVSDRFDRRAVMIVADLVRGAAMAALAALALGGVLELWHILVLVAVYGVGDALFSPAFGAIVPDVVPRELLTQANSLAQFVRPLALQLVGPALGGAVVASAGAGTAFALDAGSFAVSAFALRFMRPRPRPARPRGLDAAAREIAEGFRYVRSEPWLGWTLVVSAVVVLAFWGPFEVLVPYIVKNDLGGGADDLGLVFALGGLGSLISALVVGQRGLPRRWFTVMVATWSASTVAVAAYAFVTAAWQAMAVSFVINAIGAVSYIVWTTMMHRLVPEELRGRVMSLATLSFVGTLPISFALTGPVAGWLGVDATLLVAGALGGGLALLVLALPRVRDVERPCPPATPHVVAERS